MSDRKRRRGSVDPSLEPTVASILGLSGPLRFRLHGSSQKAHLVLRRVTLPADSNSDDGMPAVPVTAFYSLFAHKRIEVKPGKEILLAVEGEFSDRPVLIGGDLFGSVSDTEALPEPKVSRKEDPKKGGRVGVKGKRVDAKVPLEVASVTDQDQKELDLQLSMPPKMRKSWMRGRQSLPSPDIIPIRPSTPTREDVGVQAQPEYSSVGVATTPITEPSATVQAFKSEPLVIHEILDDEIPGLHAGSTFTPSVSNPEVASEDGLSAMEMSPSPPPAPAHIADIVPGASSALTAKLVPELNNGGKREALERPLSRSSSASSAPDELDIKLIPEKSIGQAAAKQQVPATLLATSITQLAPAVSSDKTPTYSGATPFLDSIELPSLPIPSSSKVTAELSPLVPGLQSGTPLLAVVDTQPQRTAYPGTSQNDPGPYRPQPTPTPQQTAANYKNQKPNGPTNHSMWGNTKQAATGSWGAPSAPSRSVYTPTTARTSSNPSTQTPPDMKSLVSLSSGPTGNPLGIRPSNQYGRGSEQSRGPQRRSPPPDGRRGVVIGNGWPPKQKGGGNNSGRMQHNAQASSSRSPIDVDQPGRKWKRIGHEEMAARRRDAETAMIRVKPEPEEDVLPRFPPSTPASSNGKSFRPPPNFVGYTPPTKVIHAPTPISAPPPSLRERIDMPARGIKRSASSEGEAAAAILSGAPHRRFRWPTYKPVYVAQMKLGGEDTVIRSIVFNSDCSQFAVCCHDHSVRIWNNFNHVEIAKLAHVAPVVSVAWMEGDTGVVSLGETGEVSKWTRVGGNQWHWAKLLDASNDLRPGTETTCFAFMRDRIAIAFPRMGVKVWLWVKGMWQSQRAILRQNVTSIKFVDQGDALLGGTADGVLWYSQVPNGTLRAFSFFKSGVYLLDLNTTRNQVLVSRDGGSAHLVSLRDDRKGKTEREYSLNEEAPGAAGQGAVFANTEEEIIAFGNVEGCLLLWEKNKVVGAFDHGEDVAIQAVAAFDLGRVVTGTKGGVLSWWDFPPNSGVDSKRLRIK